MPLSIIARPLRRAGRLLARRYVQSILDDEWRKAQNGDLFGDLNERPIEYAFALAHIAKYCPGSVLDVGTGMTAWPHLMANCGLQVSATDNVREYWSEAIWNRHWQVVDDDITSTTLARTFDMITCISVLEHITKYEDAALSIAKLLNTGGRLILTVPFNNETYIDNVYKLPGSRLNRPGINFIGQVFSRAVLEGAFSRAGLVPEYEELYDAHTGEFWSIGERKQPIRRSSHSEKHDLGCFVFRKAV